MKLIIQIPCFNEAETLPITLSTLPRSVPGFDVVEWLIVDDGSTDETANIAKAEGVDHVITHTSNQGLAHAFMTGLTACLKHGADVVVNTDADNQYKSSNIPDLTKPIIEKEADLVIGTRPIIAISHFSRAKKILQKIGSSVVRIVSQTEVVDAPSGFRAMSKEAAQKMMVFSNYTYTLETIIQAGQKNMAIKSVPIEVNENLRPSKLMSNIPSYICHSLVTMIRIFVIYRPFRFFASIAGVLFTIGFVISIRFLWHVFNGEGDGHIQSLILSSLLMGMGFQTLLIAFIADLLAANRKLMEEVRFTISNLENHGNIESK